MSMSRCIITKTDTSWHYKWWRKR